jgi:hypothetical protein
MTIKSVTTYGPDKAWSDGLIKRRFEVTLTDNDAVDHVFIIGPIKTTADNDGTAIADDLLQSQKDKELSNADISPLWNDTQADYDRRALGKAMLISDVDEFISYQPLFQAMESRSGNNAVQRAATLGVSTANYTLMQSRFNDAVGIAGGVANMNSKLWEVVPEEFK